MQLQALDTTVVLKSAGVTEGGRDPDIVTLTNGNLLVVWSEVLGRPTDVSSDTDGAVFARILSPDGVPVSDIIQVNIAETFNQDSAEAVALPGGGFAVGWTSNAVFGTNTTDADTFIRIFDSSGNTFSDFRLDTFADVPNPDFGAAPDQKLLELVPLLENQFLVLLEDTIEFVLNGNAELTAFIERPAVDAAQLTNGNVVRAFVDVDLQTGEPEDFVELRLTDKDFNGPEGIDGINEPLIFAVGSSTPLARIQRDNIELVGLAAGGFALAFVEESGAETRINLTVLGDSANIEHGAVVIPQQFDFDSTNGQFDMIALSGGGLALALETVDDNGQTLGIDILLFDADGTLQTRLQATESDDGDQHSPSLTELADGRIALSYVDEEAGGLNGPLRIAYFEVDGPVVRVEGTSGDDVLGGAGGNDRILGDDGDDTINGRGGHDKLYGQDGNDMLLGAAGRDALKGGDGDDVLNGGAGADGLGGGAGNDRLIGGNGADVLGGGLGNDTLQGGNGDDILKGGHGADRLTGNGGEDVFRFFNGDSGRDTVVDYNTEDDIISIALNGLSEDDVTVSSNGTNTLISIGDDTEVLLRNVDLTAQDITFDFF